MSYNAAKEADQSKIKELPESLRIVAIEVCDTGDWSKQSAHDSLVDVIEGGVSLTNDECHKIMTCFDGGYWD